MEYMEYSNLSTKIFSETCCKGCSMKTEENEIQYESLPIIEKDATGQPKCCNS